MSARAPRRSFATPFVLTLAAIPACTVQSAPPPQGPTQGPTQTEAHDHREPHANPPPPETKPESPPVTVVANPPPPETKPESKPDVDQEPKPGPAKARGYRQWTVTRTAGKCESMVKVHCPEGAMCNPPPPAKYVCPKTLADNSSMDIIQHAEKGDCFVDYGEISCPPNASCNPPRPQKVACPK